MIVNNANLVTMWPNEPLVEGALLALEGKTIVDFGKVGKLADRYDDPEVVDVAGALVLPGMVNAHARLASSFAMTRPPVTGLHARDLRVDCEAVLDEEAVYWSTLVWLLDAVRSGVTTVFALHESPSFVEGSLEVVARAFQEAGLRGALAYATSERSSPALALRENARHIVACREASNELLTGLVGLEASAGLSDDTIAECVRVGRELGAALHVATPAAELSRLLGAAALARGGLVHVAGEVGRQDEAGLVASGTTLVRATEASLFAGVAPTDLLRAASARIPLGMGTDGAGVSVLEEFRIASLHQIGRGGSPIDGIRLALRAAFTGNAALASSVFNRQVGVVKPGARADLVVLDYRPVTPMSQVNLAEHLLWGGSRSAVRTVIANGRMLYHNGVFLTLDEERVRARAREVAAKTWERI